MLLPNLFGLFLFQRSLRDRIGYPCACENQSCKCCILIHTTIKPLFSKEGEAHLTYSSLNIIILILAFYLVCIDASLDNIKPIARVKMLVNQKPVITYNLKEPIDSCIQYKIEQGWKFCLDFKQVHLTSMMFHFCINLQMYHQDQFTIFYFRCLDLPRTTEKLQRNISTPWNISLRLFWPKFAFGNKGQCWNHSLCKMYTLEGIHGNPKPVFKRTTSRVVSFRLYKVEIWNWKIDKILARNLHGKNDCNVSNTYLSTYIKGKKSRRHFLRIGLLIKGN